MRRISEFCRRRPEPDFARSPKPAVGGRVGGQLSDLLI
jgi:hypothetical protein